LRRIIKSLQDDKSSISPEQSGGRNFVLVKGAKLRERIKFDYGEAVRYVFSRKSIRYPALQQTLKEALKNSYESIGIRVADQQLSLEADSLFDAA
jgi:hypothetical protein